jgi:hypothetical protein
MASGSGGTFGQALVDFARQHGYTGRGELRSYDAKGWHAQISKLTSSDRGSKAADAVGLDVSARTLQRWLAGDQTPSAANRELIDKAYRAMAGSFPPAFSQREFQISGRVATGGDSRVRGDQGNAPLRIDGRAGNWGRIAEKWEAGELDADELEDLFIEDVLEEDLGDGSDGWDFPGGGYTIR